MKLKFYISKEIKIFCNKKETKMVNIKNKIVGLEIGQDRTRRRAITFGEFNFIEHPYVLTIYSICS